MSSYLPEPACPLPPTCLQLPLWPDDVRGLPNVLARSALFGIGNRHDPRIHHRLHRTIQTLAGWTLSARGEELRQDDEDVFLQLVHLARERDLSQPVGFSGHSMLRAVRWSTDTRSYARLKATIDRLQGASIRLSSHDDGARKVVFQGSLVRKFALLEPTRLVPGESIRRACWQVWMEPEIVSLFGANSYTRLGWQQRLSLRSPLAKFLHSYYSTHLTPYAMRVETMRALCGSTMARLGDFRKALRTALGELVRVRLLDSFAIGASDLVHVVRSSSGARVIEGRRALLPG